ncbi:sulfurtransferase [Geminocystis sp. NIES-3709]|uniref:sulfurtransferase n=1 Tax=Geminocystis sp. NIES-3709 TaxID=1617448 RepID=UPI0005FC7BD8|nr:sulfurtransferase [Geminocystis sp. NIES-3709]BAQ63446.1 thiosulfate sulfurtransferase [Geminocystis sp. NIES-3709]
MSQTRTIVSAQWLKDNLDNPNVKIIDCRFRLSDSQWGYHQYIQSHIQNSYYLHLNQDLSSPVELYGGRHPLPDSEVLGDKFAQMGIIHNETTIVAYDDSRFAFASRLWWLLKYLGHDRVFLLDGGWQEWTNLNYPVSDQIPDPVSLGSFISQPRLDWVVDINYVRQCQSFSETIIIDARSSDRYSGKFEPIDPIAGSIPGAKNVFWQDITTEQGFLKTKEELESIWSPYKHDQEIIVYCGSGVTACVDIFALKTIEIDQCKLYVGGWSDWCSYPENFK